MFPEYTISEIIICENLWNTLILFPENFENIQDLGQRTSTASTPAPLTYYINEVADDGKYAVWKRDHIFRPRRVWFWGSLICVCAFRIIHKTILWSKKLIVRNLWLRKNKIALGIYSINSSKNSDNELKMLINIGVPRAKIPFGHLNRLGDLAHNKIPKK